MLNRLIRLALAPAALVVSASPAFAHHLMGGRLPASLSDGLLSGLGHPIIGLDHFAAVVAVGCLAAAHRAGALLAVGYVMATMVGVALHVQGFTLPGGEVLVALTVIGLALPMLIGRAMTAGVALALFAAVGFVHGYALGESIYGAEPTPLYAYLAGLAVIQSAIALAAMGVARLFLSEPVRLRLMGAGIAGVGLVFFVQQVLPGA